MNVEDLILKAKAVVQKNLAQMEQPYFQDTMAWLSYLGLLTHNKIPPRRCRVALVSALEAGTLEPRIYELLPAIMIKLPKAFTHTSNDIPHDLREVIDAIKTDRVVPEFRGVPGEKCKHWVSAACMSIAKRRLNFRRLPRKVCGKGKKNQSTIGAVIKDGRTAMALTQKQFAEKHDVSLRIVRDLEQGKMTASLHSVDEILKIFGRRIVVI